MLDYYLFKQVYDLFVEQRFEEAKSLLAELQGRYIEMADENEQLKSQVREFEDILYLAKNIEFDGRGYWLKTGTMRQGPFCQACFDKDGQLVRMQEDSAGLHCTACGSRHDAPRVMPVPFLANVAGATGLSGATTLASPDRTRREHPKVIQLYK